MSEIPPKLDASDQGEPMADYVRQLGLGEQKPNRLLYGWLLIAALGTLMFGLQTLQYLGKEPGEKSFTQQESALKMTQIQERGFDWLYSIAAQSKEDMAKADNNIALMQKKGAEDVLKALGKDIAKNDSAATIALAASIKLKQAPPKEAVERLSKSKDSKLKLLVTEPTKITSAQDKELWEMVKGGSYSQGLAAAEILSKRPGGEKAKASVLPDSEVSRSIFSVVLMLGLIGLGTLTLAFGCVMHFTGYWKSKRILVDIPTADRYAVFVGLFFVLFILLPSFVALAIRGLPIDAGLKTLLSFGSLTVAFLVLIGLPIHGKAIPYRQIFGSFEKPFRQVMVGLASYAANFPLIVVLAIVVSIVTAPFKDVLPQPSHPINEMMSGSNPWPMIFAGMTAVLLAPLLEEVVFRGLFFPALARIMTPLAACMIQGFLFAAIHPQGLPAIPMLMVIGVMGSVVAWKEGSILPAMVMHAAHNGTILFIGMNLM